MKRQNTETVSIDNGRVEYDLVVTYNFQRNDDDGIKKGIWDTQLLSCDVDVLGVTINILPTLSEEEQQEIINTLTYE